MASEVVRLSATAVNSLAKEHPDMREILQRVEIRAVRYASDGLGVTGYVVAPKRGRKLPAVIFNRGGNREFGALNDTLAAFFLARIASWGYVVAASNYRGNGGSEGREEFGGADVNDVLNLLPLLEGLPQVDATRVGMVGWSRGGLMTCLALARTERIRAAIIGAGAYDAERDAAESPAFEAAVYAQLIPDYPTRKAAALEARSPVRWTDRLHKRTPILMLHGTADVYVNPQSALDMASGLLANRHPFRLVMFEGGTHFLREHEREVDRLTREWLDRYVRDGQPPP